MRLGSLDTVESLQVGDLISTHSRPLVVVARHSDHKRNVHQAVIVYEHDLFTRPERTWVLVDNQYSSFDGITMVEKGKYKLAFLEKGKLQSGGNPNDMMMLFDKKRGSEAERMFYGTNFDLYGVGYRLHPHELPFGMATDLLRWISELQAEITELKAKQL